MFRIYKNLIKTSNHKKSRIFQGKNKIKDFRSCILSQYKDQQIFILTDENTFKYCLPALLKLYPDLFRSQIITIKSNERNKNLQTCSQIWDVFENGGATRNSLLLCLGGGVVCDLGGFAASVFKRGIAFINIPTTLLAMTDASIGGKTGVDYNNLKNELGVFNQAAAIFIYPEFLHTLDKKQLVNGWAEVVKHALIADDKFWNKIKKINPATQTNWENIIQKSVKIKKKIIKKDPLEQNIRKKLNFGHTIGHAIESYSLIHDESPLLHGEAVALGMIGETTLSYKTNKLPKSKLIEIIQYLLKIFPSYTLSQESIPTIIKLMTHDKKNNVGNINFSLLSGIGECNINKVCTEAQICDVLNTFIAKA